MKKFEDKVAIVTGSTSGIGRQAAYQLAENGAKVVITGPQQEKEAVDHIIAAGGEAMDSVFSPRSCRPKPLLMQRLKTMAQ